jgi:hypothetical protein
VAEWYEERKKKKRQTTTRAACISSRGTKVSCRQGELAKKGKGKKKENGHSSNNAHPPSFPPSTVVFVIFWGEVRDRSSPLGKKGRKNEQGHKMR